MKRSRICALRAPRCSPHERRERCRRVADLAQLFASYLVEKYIAAAAGKPDFHSGLPIWQLRKVEDYVRERLAEEISVETLAELVELSPFHFSRVFKQTTGMSPLQFVTRQRITRAQQLIRETSRSSDRSRPGGRLHQPKPFREGLSARDRRDPERIPQPPLRGLPPLFRKNALGRAGSREKEKRLTGDSGVVSK